MDYSYLPAVALLMTIVASPAQAQLVGAQADGSRRVCTYRDDGTRDELREYHVGLGEDCPAYIPVGDKATPAPPTAPLVSISITDGQRRCTYSQRNSRWTFAISISRACPIAAGLLASESPRGNQ